MLQRLERTPVNHLLAAAGKGIFVRREVEVDVRNILAHHLDFTNIPATQPAFMRQTNEFNGERVEAHRFGRYGVDRHHIAAGQDEVFDQRNHAARAGTVAREGSVHNRENAGMDFFLNGQQVDQGLMNHAVSPVAFIEKQPSESVAGG